MHEAADATLGKPSRTAVLPAAAHDTWCVVCRASPWLARPLLSRPRYRSHQRYLLRVDPEQLVDRKALRVPIKLQPQDRLLLLRGGVVP